MQMAAAKNSGLIDATAAFIVAERQQKGQASHPLKRRGDLFVLLVILGFAVGSELHNKYGNRSDQDDVNIASFMQKKS